MAFTRSLKRRIRAVVPAAVFLALTGYFGWNATRGELGLRAYARRQNDLRSAEAALSGALAEQTAWQTRVSALQPAHLDSDALDQQARQMLDLSAPDDIIIPMKNP